MDQIIMIHFVLSEISIKGHDKDDSHTLTMGNQVGSLIGNKIVKILLYGLYYVWNIQN